jgi:hypothetical protein
MSQRTSPVTTTRLAIALVLALAAGCGSEDVDAVDAEELAAIGAAQRAGRPIDVDPCTLLRRAEVQAALGVDVLDPRPPESIGIDPEQMPVRMCEFGAADGGLRSLVISVGKRSTSVDQFREKLAAVEKLGQMTWAPVPGVGDAAVWNAATGLSFVRNEIQIEVMDAITESPSDDPPESVLRLARLIAQRL